MLLGYRLISLFSRLGWIHCDPASQHVGPNGIDVTLGNEFYVMKPGIREIDTAMSNSLDCFTYTRADMIRIAPNSQVIGVTREFVGSTVRFLVPELRTRSTLAGWGGDLGGSALMGDAGFHSRWRLALRNHQPVSLNLYSGTRVGQVVFHLCVGGGLYAGRYNKPSTEWGIRDMLPRRLTS